MHYRQRKTELLLPPESDMQTKLQRSAGTCRVSVAGRITIDSSPDLRLLLFDHLATEDCTRLTVDFSDVEYIDTSGLAVLLEVLKKARWLNKAFDLTGLRDRPRYLLEATRVLPLFNEVTGNLQP